MSLITAIYLVSLLTELRLLAISIFLFYLFVLFLWCVFLFIGAPEIPQCKYFSARKIKYYKIIAMLSLFLSVVIPRPNNIYAMLAIAVGENIYQSEIGQKGLELLSLKLDELLPKPKAN